MRNLDECFRSALREIVNRDLSPSAKEILALLGFRLEQAEPTEPYAPAE
jgi:hypothetical protein